MKKPQVVIPDWAVGSGLTAQEFFEAESVSKLMFQIANELPPPTTGIDGTLRAASTA